MALDVDAFHFENALNGERAQEYNARDIKGDEGNGGKCGVPCEPRRLKMSHAFFASSRARREN
jgi:hypothetical protein